MPKENEQGKGKKKNKNRKNKGKSQKDDKVSLKYTKHTQRTKESLLKHLPIHTNIKSQMKVSAYCLLEASVSIVVRSQ